MQALQETDILGLFLPLYLTGAVYREFVRSILPELLQDVNLHTRIHLWFMCNQVLHHLSRCSSGIFEQSVSRTMDRTRWPNSMACSLP